MLEADIVRLILGALFLLSLSVVFKLRVRKAARLLMTIGSLHFLAGLWLGRESVARIFREKFFGEADSSLGEIPARMERELVFWFLLWGVFAFLLGQTLSWMQRRGVQAPAYIGWELAAISLAAALLAPKDGFWLLLLPAYLLIKDAKNNET